MSSYRVDSLSASSSRQICRYFANGHCAKGASCRYLHIRESSSSSNDGDERYNDYYNISGESSSSTFRLPYSNSNNRRSNSGNNSPTRNTTRVSPQICKYFLQDRCMFGNSCWYKHEKPDNDSTKINNTDSQKNDLKNQKDKQKAKEVVEEEYVCSICYETPKLFGLLVHCDHIFCRDCIKEWRQTSNVSSPFQDNDTTKTCPVCRKNSPYFVPSFNFTKSGPQKEQIISDYKDRMARIPCKYFTKSRKCPFADDCFYQHANPDGSRCILGPPRKKKSKFLTGIRYIGGELDISFHDLIDGFEGFPINFDLHDDITGSSWGEHWTDEVDDDDDVENSHYISERHLAAHLATMEVVANEDDDDNAQWDSHWGSGW